MNKHKVLIVYDVSYPSIDGGGQRRLYEIASRLIDRGEVEVDWVCFQTWKSEEENQKNSKIKYIGIPGFNGLYNKSGSRRILEPIEFLYALHKAKIDYTNYDVIWSGQWPILHLISWSFNKNIRNKLVVDWWEFWGKTWFSYSKYVGWIGYLIEKFILARITKFSKLVTISNTSQMEIKDLLKSSKNLQLIDNGIDSSLLNEISTKSNKIYDLGYLGRLKDHKRVDLLIKSIKWIEDHKGQKLNLVVLGDGPERNNLENLTHQLEINERINFKGAISSNHKVYTTLAQSKVFVNPSTKEGGGSITLFESFALGLPAIAFECKDGIDPDLIGNNVRGLLVNEVSYQALGESISSLINNKSKLEKMSIMALSYSKKYHWDTIADMYLNLFKSLKNKYDN
jgi:glycosyltransferase involved in cell wall biosynthesis